MDLVLDFAKTKVYSSDKKIYEKLFKSKYFGKYLEDEQMVVFSLPEAMYLLDKGMAEIKDVSKNKFFTKEEFYKKCCLLDKEFPQKYVVFKDLRDRGYVVKSGFKFGTHFRVYDKGVNPYKEGEKTKTEHTKFNVHAFSENKLFSFHELSRYVRLSQNIRAKALVAIVDEENEVTYYLVSRIKP